ncbi:MAG: extracellular solute-binding protein [Roseiflexus sp.]|nr:extracellular solute-binding protein [Roseiflexus sp.]MCS7290638.1 extracellular solute-binding protein [Roseiflexus sp.]MDW8145510.1 extracellular solute-binding protein [Roseiflexaceae bacterium]MDW8231430.1 extracellular solute-binding protein [Roseiflexaceae bacterium]
MSTETRDWRRSRRAFLRMAVGAGAGAILAACGQAAPPAPTAPAATTAPGTTATPAAQATAPAQLPPPPPPGPLTAKDAGGMEKLIELARAEGSLSTIALPDDWANYGEMKKKFLEKYPFIKHEDLNPDASSAQEIEAIKANAGSKGPQAPDVIDVGFTWGEQAKKEGLLQPYKVEKWDEIPDNLKDPEGFWYADYYGVMAFEVNTQVVKNIPQDWSDLLKPEYKGQVALAGDPTGSGQAINAVWAAALGNGGSLDNPMPGLEFFKKLNEAGNLLPVIAKPATIAKGETPIALRWDYNALANRDQNAGNVEIAVVVPKSGSLAGVYVQAISAYSPRPHAARLWMEFLYSDEGQLIWLKGYATPVRFEAMRKAGLIPQELLDRLPKTDAPVAFPTGSQINAAFDKIKTNWPTIVGATVK